MSEIKTPIKTLNGHALEDTEARAKVNQLSEEIAKLGGGTIVDQSGVVVSLNCDEGTEITVSGETTETVTLVHHGKNFLPAYTTEGTKSGVQITPNSDGSITVKGTATAGIFIDITHPTNAPHYLPAGKYALSHNIPADSGISLNCQNSAGTWYGSQSGKVWNLAEPISTKINISIKSGSVVDATLWVQLESGESVTNYECYKGESASVTLPTTLSAYDGANYLYTTSGDIITASMKQSASNVASDAYKFDCTVFGLPVVYLTGDTSPIRQSKDNEVTLDYEYGERRGTCTLKGQGSSSYQTAISLGKYGKFNYTIKFDEPFEAKEGWGEQKKYVLKANFIDFTHCRNVVNARLWGQIVASRTPANEMLAACPNYGAVDGFPICLVINDEYHGVYTFNIPKDEWMMNMGNGTNECILCADLHTVGTRFQGEAVIDEDFSLEYITDKENTAWATTSLNNLISACANSDGSDLDTTIASMLDWESAIDYYIFTCLLRGDDMTDKNYLLSTYDGTKWFFGAYDMDSTYGLLWNGKSFLSATEDKVTFERYRWGHKVMGLIHQHKRDALKARYKQLRETVMSEDNVAMQMMNFAGAISKVLKDEDNRKWPSIPNTDQNNVHQILNWYRLRCEMLDAEMAAL